MFDIIMKTLDAICSLVKRSHCFGSQRDVHDHLMEQGSGIGVYRNTVICADWAYSLQPSQCWSQSMKIEYVQQD
ncbi:unnamed protein product [Haemonchus placei]|uniref:Secreted protein n=1 Tax=Haemonchus placei TaxID=6290 RepID=A0A0N4W6G1_HAEPC|nr:unnamed protein product [Haemonchus placei]